MWLCDLLDLGQIVESVTGAILSDYTNTTGHHWADPQVPSFDHRLYCGSAACSWDICGIYDSGDTELMHGPDFDSYQNRTWIAKNEAIEMQSYWHCPEASK